MHSKQILDPMNLIRPTQAETRAAALLREQQRVDARRAELLEQTSAHNSPAKRIEIWERLHSLALPTQLDHPLLDAIAKQTDLALTDVLDEQQRRRSHSTELPQS